MNEKIKNALIVLLNNKIIVTSWGLSNMVFNEKSFSFYVEGLIYQGKVVVALHNTGYRVSFDNDIVIDCSLDDLVNTMDINIEKTSHYLRNIEKLIFPDIE